MRRYWIARGIKIAVMVTVAVFVFGLVVMSLWNWLMPTLFGLKAITYWQAWGLLVLCWILFGGLRHGGHGHWRRHMHERWAQMTPEEREKFREKMRQRWHHCHDHDHDDEPPAGGGNVKA